MTTKTNHKKTFVNLFGAFGYLSCFLQWLWTTLLCFSLIKALFLLMNVNADVNNYVPEPTVVAGGSMNLSTIIFMAVVVITMLILTIYAFIKIPLTIAKTSKKVVAETAGNLAPLLLRAQHKKDTTIRRKKLTSKLIFVIKIVLIVVPLILAYLTKFLDEQMIEYGVSIVVSLWLAGSSVLFFGFQYVLAKLFGVKRQLIW